MFMKGLTQRQSQILHFITEHFNNHGYWPSIREIQTAFDFNSTNSVMGHLKALEQKKHIFRVPGQARAYQLIQPLACAKVLPFASEESVYSIPIYGNIPAGYPDGVESASSIGSLQVDVSTIGITRSALAKTFALKVQGDSMIDAGILDGDLVVVEQKLPKNKDIVAALIDNEITLKRYMHESGMASPYLKAENPQYPALYPVNELYIQGVVKAVIRSL